MNSFVYNSDIPVAPKSGKSIFQYWDVIPFLGIHLMCIWALSDRHPARVGRPGHRQLLSKNVRRHGGYHRYFSHRSYKTSRVFQFLLAFFAMTSAQKGVLWWAAHHRHHHRYSDQEPDFHSPLQKGSGFLMSDGFYPKNPCEPTSNS